MQFTDLFRKNDTAAPTENLDVSAALFLQQVIHVLEVLHMTTLITRHRDRLHVLLDRAIDHFLNRTIVTKVDHFRATALNDPPHDVDSGIVPVKKRGSGNNPDLIVGNVNGRLFHTSG